MHDLRLFYLKVMGIDVYHRHLSLHANNQAMPWHKLADAVNTCRACALHLTRSCAVVGSGSQQAKLMIVGEAPGFYEDQQGEPFVGKAGELLEAILYSIALTRQDVYITNVLKCRPPNNRDPQPLEVEQCASFLQQQIALIAPRFLLALGKVAANHLLNTKTALNDLRNKIHYYNANIKLLVTYHPAYLLRNPHDKAQAYQDWQALAGLINPK